MANRHKRSRHAALRDTEAARDASEYDRISSARSLLRVSRSSEGMTSDDLARVIL